VIRRLVIFAKIPCFMFHTNEYSATILFV
jgi:hypothetical protein